MVQKFDTSDACRFLLLTELQFNLLKQPQQILVLAPFHHLYLGQNLVLYFLRFWLFKEITSLIYSPSLFSKQSYFWFYLYKFVQEHYILYFHVFLLLKIILNVWNRIWSIRQIKLNIQSRSRDFKFIVICRFYLFPRVINTQISQCHNFIWILKIKFIC